MQTKLVAKAAVLLLLAGSGCEQQAVTEAVAQTNRIAPAHASSDSSDDAPLLASIEVSEATLNQSFDPSVFTYTSNVSFSSVSTTLTVVAADPASELRINGDPATSGEPSARFVLAEGSNVVTIDVDSPDSQQTTTYEVDIVRADAATFFQHAYVKPTNTSAFDHFGHVLAIDNDTAVVGAPFEDADARGINQSGQSNSLIDSGAAYILSRVNGVWSQVAYVKPHNPEKGRSFGISTAIKDGIVVIGSAGEDQPGAVYVFTRIGDMWTQQAILHPDDPAPADQFGASVAIDGALLAVGAPNRSHDDTPTINGGAVYVYARSGDTWLESAQLTPSEPGDGFGFGHAVAIHRGNLFVGTPFATNDEGEPDAGVVHSYVLSAYETWESHHDLRASNTGAGDLFGFSLAIHKGELAVGAPGEASSGAGSLGLRDNDAPGSGAAYVFRLVHGEWVEHTMLKASNNDAGDGFGSSVALDFNGLAVGAPNEQSLATDINGDQADNDGLASGAVYVFSLQSGTWLQQAYIKASNTGELDAFGTSLALDGDWLLVGAPLEDSVVTGFNGYQSDNSATQSGAVYLFQRP